MFVLYVWFEFFFPTKNQMTYLELQHNDVKAAKEEVQRLRIKMKTFERYLV